MAPKKGKKKKSGKKRKSAKGPAIIDGISTEEMSKEQLEQHIHRLREGSFIFNNNKYSKFSINCNINKL